MKLLPLLLLITIANSVEGLGQSGQTHIVKRKIKGLKSPYMADPIYNMEHLWIEESN